MLRLKKRDDDLVILTTSVNLEYTQGELSSKDFLVADY